MRNPRIPNQNVPLPARVLTPPEFKSIPKDEVVNPDGTLKSGWMRNADGKIVSTTPPSVDPKESEATGILWRKALVDAGLDHNRKHFGVGSSPTPGNGDYSDSLVDTLADVFNLTGSDREGVEKTVNAWVDKVFTHPESPQQMETNGLQEVIGEARAHLGGLKVMGMRLDTAVNWLHVVPATSTTEKYLEAQALVDNKRWREIALLVKRQVLGFTVTDIAAAEFGIKAEPDMYVRVMYQNHPNAEGCPYFVCLASKKADPKTLTEYAKWNRKTSKEGMYYMDRQDMSPFTPGKALALRDGLLKSMTGAIDMMASRIDLSRARFGYNQKPQEKRDQAIHLTMTFEGAQMVMWDIDMWRMALEGAEAMKDVPITKEMMPTEPELWLSDDILLFVDNKAPENLHLNLPCRCELSLIVAMPGTLMPAGRSREEHRAFLLNLREKMGGSGMTEEQYEAFEDQLFERVVRTTQGLPDGMTARNYMEWPYVTFWCFFMNNERFDPMPYIRELGPIFLGEPFGSNSNLLLPMEFLRQTIIRKKRQELPKNYGKKKNKNGKPARLPLVTRVILRQVDSEEAVQGPVGMTTEEAGVPGDGRDWQCRWIVRRHVRNQWYPSEGVHRKIYIEPYFKGPDDKPLRDTREVVQIVKR